MILLSFKICFVLPCLQKTWTIELVVWTVLLCLLVILCLCSPVGSWTCCLGRTLRCNSSHQSRLCSPAASTVLGQMWMWFISIVDKVVAITFMDDLWLIGGHLVAITAPPSGDTEGVVAAELTRVARREVWGRYLFNIFQILVSYLQWICSDICLIFAMYLFIYLFHIFAIYLVRYLTGTKRGEVFYISPSWCKHIKNPHHHHDRGKQQHHLKPPTFPHWYLI